jgi:hypothetical protein
MKHGVLGSLAGLATILFTALAPGNAAAISPDLRKQLSEQTTQVEYTPDVSQLSTGFSRDVSTLEGCINGDGEFLPYNISNKDNGFIYRDNLGQELIAYAQNLDSLTTQGNEPEQFEFLLNGMQVYAQHLIEIGNAPEDPQKGRQLLSAIQEARTTLQDYNTLQSQLVQDDSALQQYVTSLDSNSLNQRQQRQLFQRLFSLDNNPELQTQIATILKQSFENLPGDRIGIIGTNDIPYAIADNRVVQLSVIGVDIQDTNRKLLAAGPVRAISKELNPVDGFYLLNAERLAHYGINSDNTITIEGETGLVYATGDRTTTDFLFSLYQQLPIDPTQQQRLLVSYMFSGIDPDNTSGQITQPRNRGKSVVLSFVPMLDTTVEVMHPNAQKYSTAICYISPEMEQGVEDYKLPAWGVSHTDLENIESSLDQYDSAFADYVRANLPELKQSAREQTEAFSRMITPYIQIANSTTQEYTIDANGCTEEPSEQHQPIE